MIITSDLLSTSVTPEYLYRVCQYTSGGGVDEYDEPYSGNTENLLMQKL